MPPPVKKNRHGRHRYDIEGDGPPSMCSQGASFVGRFCTDPKKQPEKFHDECQRQRKTFTYDSGRTRRGFEKPEKHNGACADGLQCVDILDTKRRPRIVCMEPLLPSDRGKAPIIDVDQPESSTAWTQEQETLFFLEADVDVAAMQLGFNQGSHTYDYDIQVLQDVKHASVSAIRHPGARRQRSQQGDRREKKLRCSVLHATGYQPLCSSNQDDEICQPVDNVDLHAGDQLHITWLADEIAALNGFMELIIFETNWRPPPMKDLGD